MATVTYEWPIAGITAPTATQSAKFNEINATVAPVLYDTTVDITHNWALSAEDLAAGFPEVLITPLQVQTSQPFISARLTNKITITGDGDADLYRVTIRRPNSKFI